MVLSRTYLCRVGLLCGAAGDVPQPYLDFATELGTRLDVAGIGLVHGGRTGPDRGRGHCGRHAVPVVAIGQLAAVPRLAWATDTGATRDMAAARRSR
jgi:hypothetical protein